MQKAILGLENKQGETVRVFRLETPKAVLIQRGDTSRLELVASADELERQNIPFRVIENIELDKLATQPLQMDSGTLRVLRDEPEKVTPSQVFYPEESGYPSIFKKTLAVHVAMGLILLITSGLVMPLLEEEQEPVVVPVRARPLSVQEVTPGPRTNKVNRVKPKKSIVKRRAIVRPKKSVRKSKTSVARRSSKVRKGNADSLNNIGALGALGRANKKGASGGVDIRAAKTTAGAGMGGSGGSGGVQSAVYGKGLVNVAAGPQARPQGAGGYGTRGSGGGRAGYGKMSLVGSSGAYAQPLERMAVISGGLDPAQVDAVIRKNQGQVRYCYEKALQQKPNLRGRVSVNFTIGPRGLVQTARIDHSSIRAGTVEGCIVSRLKTWKFPRPEGNVSVKVNYPFVLKRVSQG